MEKDQQDQSGQKGWFCGHMYTVYQSVYNLECTVKVLSFSVCGAYVRHQKKKEQK